ncbi:hypothetical protein SLS53_004016 [Cytospora paraplurivora]|uniref:BTB domain-containing protein n=1 Tax=Cytospora paraplurivora TaxID=2898453 RepID=A0AAN9U943_9PEZI
MGNWARLSAKIPASRNGAMSPVAAQPLQQLHQRPTRLPLWDQGGLSHSIIFLILNLITNLFICSGVSPIVTLVVGHEHRIFAAHEHVLCNSPYFADTLKNDQYTDQNRRISLPDESPEIFSSVLEYLYKGDYYPRLVHNKRHNLWEIERQTPEDAHHGGPVVDPYTVYHKDAASSDHLLKDTVIYCAADRYGLEELKRVALRKQGLQSGIQCSTILSSARYAYANTPDTDSKLRAHYLALIIRSRGTFKHSGTMQLEMYNGGTQLFFDLFVALCNHVDDVSAGAQNTTPRSNRFI